jgi:hypothetical protein
MRFVCVFALGGLLAAGWTAAAEEPPVSENWPAWRGDGGGISLDKHLPLAWSETENVRWRTALPGEGNSSPIVWGNRVFLTTALDEGEKRLVLCFDADNGKLLWKTQLLPGIKTTLYPKTGFAAPTPVTDGQRVYVFFDEPGLVALDMQGNVVWTCRLGPFQCPYNMASSPVLYKDLVIQCCDHHGPSFIVALGRARAASAGERRGPPAAWATSARRWRSAFTAIRNWWSTPSRWWPTIPIPARNFGLAMA